MKHRTKIRIYSSYLALGSIALYLSLTHFSRYMWISNYISSVFKDEILSSILPSFTCVFVAGILMIITYYGLLNLKKYPKYTGIVGCFFFVLHDVYYFFQNIESIEREYLEYLIVLTPKLLTMIASVILLILTLIYWKKLSD